MLTRSVAGAVQLYQIEAVGFFNIGDNLFASFPLLFQPGSEWNYGVSTDVLGRVVEVVSGQSLDAFFQERIFDPLGMTDAALAILPQAEVWHLGFRREIAQHQPAEPTLE